MIWRVLIPLAVVLLLALIAFFWAVAYRKRHQDRMAEEVHEREVKWAEEGCQFPNPKTGARCERVDFHLSGHFVCLPNGDLSFW